MERVVIITDESIIPSWQTYAFLTLPTRVATFGATGNSDHVEEGIKGVEDSDVGSRREMLLEQAR